MMKVKYVNLVNLILDKPVIPEFLQEECTADRLADALEELLENEDKRKKQVDGMREAMKQLGVGQSPSPSVKAAQTVLAVIKG